MLVLTHFSSIEHEALSIELLLVLLPARRLGRDVLLGGAQDFF
jgi:hypothetical protein